MTPVAPVIGVFPVAFVAIILFVVLLVAIGKGRVLSALVGFGGVLLIVGSLLLFGGWLHLRPVAGHGPPRIEQIWNVPGATWTDDTITSTDRRLPAERPEQPYDRSVAEVARTASADLSDQPPGPPRPAWMDAPMGRVDGLYRTRATVGPWMSRTECERELRDVLRDAVATYADHLLGEGKGRFVNLSMSDIQERIVRGEWEERRQDTIHTMVSLHELLEFDRDANRMIEASYRRSVVDRRLGYLAAGGGTLLGLLTIVFGYLKLDTLTRGYYTGRLRLSAGAAILALAVIAGLLVMA